MHPEVDLQQYSGQLMLKRASGKRYVHDPIRRKYVVFTPEEFVRQLLILYLLEQGYNSNRISVEKTIIYNEMPRRFDLVIYDKSMAPFLLVECKAADSPINLTVFEQISRYNTHFQAPFLLVTNGLTIRCCEMDYSNKTYTFLDHIPSYPVD